MKKETISYSSPLDALVAISKRLTQYEIALGMESEIFFNKYSKGELQDDEKFVEWANDYRHYLALRHELERKLKYAA